jgi:uncharacterized protein (DUF1800 family)
MTQTKRPEAGTATEVDDDENSKISTAVRQRRRILGVLALGAVASACSKSDTLTLDGADTALAADPAGSGSGVEAGTVGSTAPDAANYGVLEVRTKPETVALPVPKQDAATSTSAAASAKTSASTSGSSTSNTASSNTASSNTTSATTASSSTASSNTASSNTTSKVTSTSTTTADAARPALVVKVDDTKPGDTKAENNNTASKSTTTTAAPAATSSTAQAPSTTAVVLPPTPVNADSVLVANRITFGLSPALSNQLSSMGAAAFIEDQLQRTGPDPAVESRLRQFSLLGKSRKATYDAVRDTNSGRLSQELFYSNVLRATFSRSQLYEMMCQLWMDHFNINIFAMSRTRHLHINYQEDVIRPNALGKFRDLLKATAEAPGMLTYLDNDTSNARDEQGLNENYGRELLELHSLGIDESGGHVYTEADVVAAAKAMSGWSMETSRGSSRYSEFLFRPGYQHIGDVSILNGAWTSQGTSGKQTGDSLLNFLATHPSTAHYVAFKICRRFVSDSPPAALVASTARVYLDNDTSLVPTLRHVLRSPEFAASAGQKFRRPFEHMIAALRAVNAQLPDGPTSKGAGELRNVMVTTDHLPWEWPSPDGYPDTAVEWLDGSGLSARWSFGARLARNRVSDVRVNIAAISPSASTVGELIAKLADGMGLGTLNQTDIDAIAQAVRLGTGDPASSAGDASGDIVALILAHPLFQIR